MQGGVQRQGRCHWQRLWRGAQGLRCGRVTGSGCGGEVRGLGGGAAAAFSAAAEGVGGGEQQQQQRLQHMGGATPLAASSAGGRAPYRGNEAGARAAAPTAAACCAPSVLLGTAQPTTRTAALRPNLNGVSPKADVCLMGELKADGAPLVEGWGSISPTQGASREQSCCWRPVMLSQPSVCLSVCLSQLSV